MHSQSDINKVFIPVGKYINVTSGVIKIKRRKGKERYYELRQQQRSDCITISVFKLLYLKRRASEATEDRRSLRNLPQRSLAHRKNPGSAGRILFLIPPAFLTPHSWCFSKTNYSGQVWSLTWILDYVTNRERQRP